MRSVDLVELGLIPVTCLTGALAILLVDRLMRRPRVTIYIAIATATYLVYLNSVISVNVLNRGVLFYRLGGFPPPLGILYFADELNSLLALVSSVIMLLIYIYSSTVYRGEKTSTYYALMLLLAMGIYGCLYTGDLFNFYVSIELLAISSYALTAFYSDRKTPIRAAFLYGIFGTALTSIFLLSVVVIYGSYGTVNYIDISLKARNPDLITPFSGGIHGDIVVASEIFLALATWVLLFKSAIFPNHFWLPLVYGSAPLLVVVFFSSTVDIIGLYGLMRLYHVLFTRGSVIDGFRGLMLSLLLVLGSISALIASLIVTRQRRLRGLIAYSSIVQYSLALLGIVSGNRYSVTGGVLHLIVNALGDTLVIFSSIVLIYAIYQGDRWLFKTTLVLGILNLLGVVPILPGFWSKAFLILGFVESGLVLETVIVVVSSGLSAIGYYNYIVSVLSNRYGKTLQVTIGDRLSKLAVYVATFSAVVVVFTLGLFLSISSVFRENFVLLVERSLDVDRLTRVFFK